MALMSEERRKEMEEEMSRFELEIATPGVIKPSSGDVLISNKPLSPPPAPPAVSVLIPEVLAKAPPPPPPPQSPPLHAVLRPPPPPPPIQARPQASPMRFIPHQLQRQPPRLPMRPNFIPMRGLPMEGPPGPFPAPGVIGPFVSPMGQAPPVGPQMSGPPMHPMGPGPMHMMPGPMPMPPHMGNMNISLPMPPGFCPPTGPAPTMLPGTIPCDNQQFISREGPQDYEEVPTSTSSSESSSVVVAAPAIYASPFVKTMAEGASDSLVSSNGQDIIHTSTGILNTSKTEKHYTKNEDHVVGPVVPTPNNNEEVVVPSKKKEKKKKCVRMAGGQAWEDNSLVEWDPDDFRIFCGDLGNDVTDEVLIRAFSKYTSFVKAKVIRDKRTNKTKGYGFVSFKDPQDFIKAMREMNGKYVGSRPIKLRKSTWKDRNIDLVKKKQREKEKLGLL